MHNLQDDVALREIKSRPDVKRLSIAKTVFFGIGLGLLLVLFIVSRVVDSSVASRGFLIFLIVALTVAVCSIILGFVFKSMYKTRINQLLQMRLIDATNAVLDLSKEKAEINADIDERTEQLSEKVEDKEATAKTQAERKALSDKVVSTYIKANIILLIPVFCLFLSAVILMFAPICSVLGLQDVSLFDIIKGNLQENTSSMGYAFVNEKFLNEIFYYAFFFISCLIAFMFIIFLFVMTFMMIVYAKRIRNAIENPEKQTLLVNPNYVEYGSKAVTFSYVLLFIIRFIAIAGLWCLPIAFIGWTEGLAKINYLTIIFSILFIIICIVFTIFSIYYNTRKENAKLLKIATKITSSTVAKRNTNSFI